MISRGVMRVLVGLGLPFLLIVPGVAVFSGVRGPILGLPAPIAWLFACMPLTSGCLALAWFFFEGSAEQNG
jgi:hypothetical protein